MTTSQLFTPYSLGPIELRNRTIRSAAFENMCPGNKPSALLKNYHLSVAKGGIGMTTIAYCAVDKSGVSFDGQLFVHDAIKEEMTSLADAIHKEGAKVSVQIGHCGNMTHFWTCGYQIPVGASTGFNLYSPTFHRALKKHEIQTIVQHFGEAVDFFKECHFDCIEVHAGHGYLISQFLSPYTNHRKDEYGGNLTNRMRFMNEVLEEVTQHANNEIAVTVKTNMCDGFKGGLEIDECITIAKEIEKHKVDAIVLSAGFVSKAPMLILGGAMPVKTLAHYMDTKKYWWLKAGVALFGKLMIPTVPFKELYFLQWAKKFRSALQLPLIYVGGVQSRKNCETVLNAGFDLIQMAHILINDPAFVNHMKENDETYTQHNTDYKSTCTRSNYCVARMYSLDMKCHNCVNNLPPKIKKEITENETQNKIS